MIRFFSRLFVASTLMLAAGLSGQETKAPAPPEPPVAPDKGATPVSYRSTVGNLINKEKRKEGSLAYKEWWYTYPGVEGTYVVGIAEVTITPAEAELHSFHFNLDKGDPECTPYTHDPDTNNSPINASLTAQIGGGSNIQPSISGTIRDDKVTIEKLVHTGTAAEWTADVGGARTKSGVNGLVFIARWICPAGMGKLARGESGPHGAGSAHFNWWFSANGYYYFTPFEVGTGPYIKRKNTGIPRRTDLDDYPKASCHEYFYEDGHWSCSSEKAREAGQDKKPQGAGEAEQTPKRVGQAPPMKQPGAEQRLARVNAPTGTEQASLQPRIGELAKILRLLNEDRARYGVPPLKWNDQLAQHAKEWAEQLARMGTLAHAPREGRGIERENLAQGLPSWSVERLVQEWRGEEKNYVPGNFPNVARDGDWQKVAHWTQDISRVSQEIGCAIARGSGFQWLVCRFSPGGNRDGEVFGPPVSVQPLGAEQNKEVPALQRPRAPDPDARAAMEDFIRGDREKQEPVDLENSRGGNHAASQVASAGDALAAMDERLGDELRRVEGAKTCTAQELRHAGQTSEEAWDLVHEAEGAIDKAKNMGAPVDEGKVARVKGLREKAEAMLDAIAYHCAVNLGSNRPPPPSQQHRQP